MADDRRPIRALTIWQPWMYCITGVRVRPKRCENRTWVPRELAPGDFLALHAAARRDDVEEAATATLLRREFGVIVPPLETLPRGAIVAVATLDGIEHAPRWIEGRRDAWFATRPGNVGWYLRDVVALPEPVPCRGAQGLWPLPADVLDAVRAQYKAATLAGGHDG